MEDHLLSDLCHNEAAMEPVARLLDYDDFAAIPPDGQRSELLDGRLEVNPAPALLHQRVLGRLHVEMMLALDEPGLAHVFISPVDVIFAPTTVLEPDLVVVSPGRASILTHRAIEGVPDLVVEVVSPSSRVWDKQNKSAAYARFGVPEYWIVDPDASCIDLLRLSGDAYVLHRHFEREERLSTPSFAELDFELVRVFRE
jgi:Uma2 family endonuclease